MNQASSISIVNRSILRESEPFKNETPAAFKFLTQAKTYTDASTMNASFSTAGMTKTSTKFSTLNVSRNVFVPEVKKKEFLNPYFFVSPIFNRVDETTEVGWRPSLRVKLH